MKARKSDDAPVTYGDLRRAIKIMGDFSTQMTVYTARALATTLATQPNTPEREQAEQKEKEQEARLRQLAQQLEDEFGFDELQKP